ncbi:CHAT domain-containing protein [Haliangium ochraceum]|uniref:CHAT domain-containing protein n=1 Tax=Haliangium ochraceum TaxID=80816 RepID=UPI0018F02EE5|nr:CHAT domain-containing protein [Haliangium ochraceum]
MVENLYAEASEAGAGRLQVLGEVLTSAGMPSSPAWRRLLELALCCDRAALSALDAALPTAPPRSRWLIEAEAARLCYRHLDAETAWARIRDLAPVPAEEPWLDDGPLVIHALLLPLRLAANVGRWDEHDTLLGASIARFSASDPRTLRLRLASADHALLRGRYVVALRTLDAIEHGCRGDLRLQLLALRLHALVACAGPQRDSALRALVERTLAALDESRDAPCDERDRLPSEERAALLRRVALLSDHAAAEVRAPEPEQVDSLADALAVELRARRGHTARPPLEDLAALLPRVDALLQRDDEAEDNESWARLRLLWCRLIVDLALVDRYPRCERELSELIDETARAGWVPLTMAAFDQRAVLRALAPSSRWDLAIADAGQAGNLAVTLLAECGGGDGSYIVERAFLRMLLPVLDRVIDLLLRGACAQRADARAAPRSDELAETRWQRLGRAVFDYIEQSQALALQEARRAYGSAVPSPHRFALAVPGQSLASPLPRLRRALRPRDSVLQYFVTGRFVVIFSYGRRGFEWAMVDAVEVAESDGARLERPTAHAALLHLIERCTAWLNGDGTETAAASAALLQRTVLPPAIRASLERARCKHVRVVPHDVLYRVPFGRFTWRGGLLLEQVSLSLHPTAGLAAESAERALRPRGRKRLGYLLGPDIARGAAGETAIRESLGRIAPFAELQLVDSTRAQDTEDVLAAIREVELLHVACHGTRARQRRPAYIKLGTGRWTLRDVASVQLQRCALVVLQSCWTGWMEHERSNPVQGFPQALCDAGVGAVIAPLVKVPQSLAVIFDGVFYRALRFRTAEQALRLSLTVLREFGEELVAGDPEARRDLAELGSLDVREYRYVGSTNLALYGGFTARLAGRLSFWWWRRRLRRQRARRAAVAPPARCSR